MAQFRIGTWFLIAVSIFGISGYLCAQTVSPVTVTVEAYQRHSAKFFAFDAQNKVITNLSQGEMAVTNGSSPLQVTNLSGGSVPATTQRLSVVVALDVSGSMTADNPSRINVLKNSVRIFLDMLDTTQHECAITTFDQFAYLNQDFTNSRTDLLASLNSLQPQGGTDYDAAFMSDYGGALKIASRGQYKRVVVLFTDGDGLGTRDSIVRFANANNITVYTIPFRMSAPQILESIATQTGGAMLGHLNYDAVSSQAELSAAFRASLMLGLGYEPYKVTWTADKYCYQAWRYTTIAIPSRSIPAIARYYILYSNQIPYVGQNPYSLTFGTVAPGNYLDKTIQLYSYYAQITIDNYSITNPRFTVVNWGGSAPPFTIDSGTSRFITVRYSPTDTSFQYGEIQFESNLCYYPFVGMSGGYQTRNVVNKTLNLFSPFNGDNYNTCWYTYSNWTGLAANDSIRIEWSWDNGATWSMLQDNFTGNFEQWFRSPKRNGTQNRFKISHIKMQNQPLLALKNGHAGKMNQVVLNPQNNNLAVVRLAPENTYLSTRRAYVINTQTGDTVATLLAPNSKTIQSVTWTNDGNYIITAQNGSGSGQITIWNASTYQIVRTITESATINQITVNPAGTRIAAAVGAANNPVKVYDLSSGSVLSTMLYHGNPPMCVSYSSDGTRIVSGDAMGRVVVWNATTYARVNHMDNPTPCNVTSVSFNPVAIDIVLASYQCGNSILWSTVSASQVRTFDGNIGAHLFSRCSPDGSRVITCGEKGAGSNLYLGASIVWDAVSGSTIATLDGANKPNNHSWQASWATYSSNGLYIYTANNYGGVNVWTSSGAHSRQMLVRHARGAVVSADFFPDDNKVVTMGEDGSVALHSAESLDSIRYFFDANTIASKANQVKVSQNGMYIAAVTSDLTLTIWNASNGTVIARVPNAGYGPAFNPNSQTVSVVRDSVVTIYNTSNGSVNRTYTVSNLVAGRDVGYKFDGTILYVGGGIANNGMSIIAINTNTWSEQGRFNDPNLVGRECMKLSISPGLRMASMFSTAANRTYIVDSTLWLNRTINDVIYGITKNSGYAVGSLVSNNQLRVWRVSDGATIKTINPHQGYAVNHVGISNNSSRAVAVSNDGNAWLWDFVATPIQSDSSHSPFTLGTAAFTKRDTVNFGQVVRGMLKDTIINSIIRNTGSSWAYLTGATVKDFWNRNENEFQIVQKTIGEYFYSGQSRNWELRFAPKHTGQLRGDLIITTLCDTLYIVLIGEAVDPPTQNQVVVVDFGKVEIGTQKDTVVTATIKNMTGLPLAFRSTTIAGPDVVQFSILEGGGSYTLQPNEVRQMKLRFAPTKIGKTSARIKYDYNWLGTPVYIQLAGEGVGIQRARISELPITLTSAMCGNPVPVDTSISISSIGTGALVLDSALIIGNDAPNFTILNTLPDTILAGASKNITIRFLPNRAALYNDAKLWLYTKSANKANGLYEIKLYGKRDSTSLEFDGPEAIMSNIRPFTPRDTSIVLHNTGTSVVTIPTPLTLGRFVIQSVTPNPIPGRLDALVNITFTGGDSSKSYDTLYVVQDACGKPDTIKLRAYVLSPKPTIVAISSLDVQTSPCVSTLDTTFIITNGGLLPLVLSSVVVNDTSGQFTIIHKPTKIEVGSFDSIVVRFKPTLIAKQSSYITITSNAQNADSGITIIPISGVLNKASYIFDTTQVDFVNVLATTPFTSTITITNTGTVPLNWNVPITKGLFSVTNVNPNPIPPNTSSRATVRFAGAGSGINARDTLQLKDVCGKMTSVFVSASVQTNKPNISTVASVITSVVCKNELDTFIVVKNLGGDTLVVQSLRSSGNSTITSAQVFPRIIAGGKTDTLRLHITAPQTGSNTGIITLTSNSVNDSLLTVRFTINVLRQEYSFTQPRAVFPVTKPNTVRLTTIGIRNMGSLPVRFTLPMNTGLFTFESVSKNPIPVGDSAIATLRFAGASIGTYQDTLRLRDTCGNPYSLPFTVDVTETVPAHLTGMSSLFGTEHCGAVWDTIITITNDGGEVLSVSRAWLRGINANEFTIVGDTAFTLQADEKHNLHIKHLQAPVVGIRRAELVVNTNASNAVNNMISVPVTVLKDSSGVTWQIPLVDLGSVDLGNFAEKTVNLINVGSIPQVIQTPVKGFLFDIDSIAPNPIQPGDTAVAFVRSNVIDTAGGLFETITITDNCNSQQLLIVALYVRGRGLLYADTVTAAIGETVNIPIRLSESQYVIQSGVRNITATVRWNTTMLALKSVPKGTLKDTHEDGEYRYCTFTASAIPTADSAIAILECIAALGSDTLTKVEFTDVSTDLGQADIGTRSGVAFVTGHCKEGGVRLIDRKKVTALRSVFPNPSDGFVTLDLSTPERAPISITIVDALGKTVRTLYKGFPAGDEWNFSATLTDIPSGIYQVILQTYSDVRTQRLEIVR